MVKDYIKSEYFKIIYNKWLCLNTVVLIVFTSIMCLFLNNYTKVINVEYYSNKLLFSLYLAQIWFIVFSVMYLGEEYKKSSLRTSILSVPNRIKLFVTKQICLFVYISILFLVISIVSITVINFYYSQNYFWDLVKLIWPAYISTIELCLISSSLVVISKSQVIPLSIFISGILGLSSFLAQFFKIVYYFPSLATMNCFYSLKSAHYLSVEKGILYQGILCIASLLFSGILFKCRNIK